MALAEPSLSDVERAVWAAARTGLVADTLPRGRLGTDLSAAARAGTLPRVRAEIVAWMLAQPTASDEAPAIRIRGAHIVGNLNLGGRTFMRTMELRDCYVGGRVNLACAVLPAVSFRGSELAKGLSARRLTVAHMLHLGDGFQSSGPVRLGFGEIGGLDLTGSHVTPRRGVIAFDGSGLSIAGNLVAHRARFQGEVCLSAARVGGDVDFEDASLINTGGTALNAERLGIVGSLRCRGQFTANGRVQLLDARMGSASFNGARLRNPAGVALSADRMVATAGLFCRNGFEAHGEIRLVEAQLGEADFDGSHLHNPAGTAINASLMVATAGLFCRNGFEAHGEIRLLGAKIGGNASFSGARLLNPNGDALSADNMVLGGDLYCQDGFVARGGVRLLGAKIGGSASFSSARLLNPNRDALSADNMVLGGDLYCRDGFVARGDMRLLSVKIGGDIELDGARLLNPNGDALSADNMELDGDLYCRDGFVARGQVRLLGAKIGRNASFRGARLLNPKGDAFNATRLTVAGSLRCTEQFTACGEVELLDARVALANFAAARLRNPAGAALSADRMKAIGGLICRDGFEAHGKISLVEAELGAADFDRAQLHNPAGTALNANRLTVTASLFGRDGFTTCGELSLSGARVGGDLNLSGARLIGDGGSALYLAQAQVGLTLRLAGATVSNGIIDVSGTTVRHLEDEGVRWPPGSKLAGFIYASLPSGPSGRRVNRVEWLRTTAKGTYVPQAYDQLSSVYRAGGRSRAARSVMIAKQHDRRRLHFPPPQGWRRVTHRARGGILALWSWFLRWSIGYGYAPWRGLIPFAVCWTLGSLVFAQVHPGDMTPTATAHDQFQSVVYALDLLLPVVNLRQRASWTPHHSYFWWTLGFTIGGWLIATVIVAGLTDLFKHD